jgi:hypothetical protein
MKMQRMTGIALSGFALCGLSACSSWFPAEVKPPPAGRVSVVYSGNVDGEIEPCG